MRSYITVALFAVAALANPVPWGTTTAPSTGPTGGGGGGSSSVCSTNQKQACCPSTILGLGCVLDILGGTCSGTTQCCETDQNGLIDVNLCNIAL